MLKLEAHLQKEDVGIHQEIHLEEEDEIIKLLLILVMEIMVQHLMYKVLIL